MAVKTVNAENLAQFVAEKQSLGSQIATLEQVAAIESKTEPAEGSRIVGTTTETVSTAPDPGEQKPREAVKEAEEQDEEKAPKWYRERLKTLNQEKKDLEEFAQEEYETRIALQEQLKTRPSEPVVDKDARPDRTKYKAEEAQKYEDDLLAWSERRIAARVRQEDHIRRVTEVARKEIPDFDEVIQRASRRNQQVPGHIVAAISESPVGAHLAWHMAKHPDVEKEILSLPPAAALLKLGEIQTQYLAKQKTETPAPVAETKPAPIPTTSRAPPPIASVTAGAGDVAVDLSQPTAYRDYKRIRMEQKAKERGRQRAH